MVHTWCVFRVELHGGYNPNFHLIGSPFHVITKGIDIGPKAFVLKYRQQGNLLKRSERCEWLSWKQAALLSGFTWYCPSVRCTSNLVQFQIDDTVVTFQFAFYSGTAGLLFSWIVPMEGWARTCSLCITFPYWQHWFIKMETRAYLSELSVQLHQVHILIALSKVCKTYDLMVISRSFVLPLGFAALSASLRLAVVADLVLANTIIRHGGFAWEDGYGDRLCGIVWWLLSS